MMFSHDRSLRLTETPLFSILWAFFFPKQTRPNGNGGGMLTKKNADSKAKCVYDSGPNVYRVQFGGASCFGGNCGRVDDQGNASGRAGTLSALWPPYKERIPDPDYAFFKVIENRRGKIVGMTFDHATHHIAGLA